MGSVTGDSSNVLAGVLAGVVIMCIARRIPGNHSRNDGAMYF